MASDFEFTGGSNMMMKTKGGVLFRGNTQLLILIPQCYVQLAWGKSPIDCPDSRPVPTPDPTCKSTHEPKVPAS